MSKSRKKSKILRGPVHSRHSGCWGRKPTQPDQIYPQRAQGQVQDRDGSSGHHSKDSSNMRSKPPRGWCHQKRLPGGGQPRQRSGERRTKEWLSQELGRKGDAKGVSRGWTRQILVSSDKTCGLHPNSQWKAPKQVVVRPEGHFRKCPLAAG
jgi:hypothetical protein